MTLDRVLFANWDAPQKSHEEIRLDEVTHWAHGSQYNCHALVLTHPPMTRRERVAAHRVLGIRWGDTEADVTRTQTIFRFSRTNTEVASALRAALEERKVPDRLLRFKERSRAERTRGSRTALHAKRD